MLQYVHEVGVNSDDRPDDDSDDDNENYGHKNHKIPK
jgi:hypothetical protein